MDKSVSDPFAEQARKKFERRAKSWFKRMVGDVPKGAQPNWSVQRVAAFAQSEVQAAQHPESWYAEKAREIAEAFADGRVYLREMSDYERVLQILKGD